MKPPFVGTRILEDIKFHDVIDLVDREALFGARWQFRKDQTTGEWETLKKEKVVPIFDRIVFQCEGKDIIERKAVYGHFECSKQENALLLTIPSISKGKQDKIVRFEFPRQRQEPHLCVSDFFESGFITLQLVTIGNKIIEEGARLFNEKKYSDTFFLRGMAAELTEALAKHVHKYIKRELNVPDDRGVRLSFGYPCAPNLADQKKLFSILGGERIEVKLTETYQLIPEYSTSAIISISRKAKLFHP